MKKREDDEEYDAVEEDRPRRPKRSRSRTKDDMPPVSVPIAPVIWCILGLLCCWAPVVGCALGGLAVYHARQAMNDLPGGRRSRNARNILNIVQIVGFVVIGLSFLAAVVALVLNIVSPLQR